MGVETDIRNAVYSTLNAFSSTPTANKSWPNVNYNSGKPYLRINLISIPTVAFSFDTTNKYEGFIQVDVVVKDGTGELVAVGIAEQVKSLFTRNTYLEEGTTEIGFLKPSTIGPALQEDGKYILPVTIPFIVIGD